MKKTPAKRTTKKQPTMKHGDAEEALIKEAAARVAEIEAILTSVLFPVHGDLLDAIDRLRAASHDLSARTTPACGHRYEVIARAASMAHHVKQAEQLGAVILGMVPALTTRSRYLLGAAHDLSRKAAALIRKCP